MQMSMNGPMTISMVLLNGAIAAMIALSSPAVARGGEHHHGECGEHGRAHDCGYVEHEAHGHGHHGRYFEDHHHLGYPGGIVYPPYQKGTDDRGPPTSGSTPPGSGQP
jgi:hypothetical protein